MAAVRRSRKRPGWIHCGVACPACITTRTLKPGRPMRDEEAEDLAMDDHDAQCGCDLAGFRGAIIREDRRN
jgi:hypothetical protein